LLGRGGQRDGGITFVGSRFIDLLIRDVALREKRLETV